MTRRTSPTVRRTGMPASIARLAGAEAEIGDS